MTLRPAALALTSLAATSLAPAPFAPAQPPPWPHPPQTTPVHVYVNPRSGLRRPPRRPQGGLYDAAEASWASSSRLPAQARRLRPDLAPSPPDAATPPPAPPRRRPACHAPAPRTPTDFGRHQLRPRLRRLPPLRRQLLRHQHLRHLPPRKVKLVSSLVCPGGQGDVSVFGHLLFMSVEAANGRLDCGTQGFPTPAGRLPRPPPAPRIPAEHPRPPAPPPPRPRPHQGRPHLRHLRRHQAPPGRRRPDLPRLPHPHPRPRPQR